MYSKVIYMYLILFLVIGIFFSLKNYEKNPKSLNIEKIKKSIVVVIPEKKLIKYNNNPK
jgi:predicted glycosyltransferase involved in capsule biosynthesis